MHTLPVSPASRASHSALSRRRLLQGIAATAGVALLAACGEAASPVATPGVVATAARPTVVGSVATTGSGTTTQAITPPAQVAVAPSAQPVAMASGQTAAVPGQMVSGVDGVPDAFTQRPPVYRSATAVPGKSGKVRFFTIAFSEPPSAHGDNTYWQGLEKRLGVQWDVQLAPADSYVEKYSALIAGGDLPELTYLNPVVSGGSVQFQALKQGAFTELTPYLSGDGLKAFPNLARFPAFIWKNVAFQGKIYGVPKPVLRANSVPFYRSDWAKKLGIAPPRNPDEVFAMLSAFTKNDPDGNSRPDTWGLTAWPTTFWPALFNAPNDWRKNPDGTLTTQVETDEYRQSVDFARRLFAAGLYHPDAPSLTGEQGRDAFKSSKVGLFSDGYIRWWGTNSYTRLIQGLSSPTAELTPLLPPEGTNGLGVVYNSTGYYGFTAIPAKVGKDAEKVKELLHILDYLAAPFGSEEWRFIRYGIEGTHHMMGADGTLALTDQGKSDIGPFQTLVYPLISEYLFYYPGTDDARAALDANKRMIAIGTDNPMWNLFSPTGASKQAQLDQLIKDRWTEIVVGRQPLSAVDDLVHDWRSRGGDDIRKEYQEALKGG